MIFVSGKKYPYFDTFLHLTIYYYTMHIFLKYFLIIYIKHRCSIHNYKLAYTETVTDVDIKFRIFEGFKIINSQKKKFVYYFSRLDIKCSFSLFGLQTVCR